MVITVVGAGVVGCAVAHELASRGSKVSVVDPRSPGEGATRASAGILAPYVEGHVPALLELCASGLVMWDGFVDRLRRETGRPLEYERSGTLHVAFDSAGAGQLEELAERLELASVPYTRFSGEGVGQLEPAVSPRARDGLLVQSHGFVAVPALTAALVEAATARGVTFSRARVLEIDAGGASASVVTSDGQVDCDAVVMAAGSWSAQLPAGGAPVPVKPVRGQLVHLRLPRRALTRVVWNDRCYIVPWHDGSMLIGATVEDAGFVEQATAAGVLGLLDAAQELCPSASGAAFEDVRVGLRPMMEDELPVIGRSSAAPNLIYATGHYRNGVLLAPLTARLVADLVMEGREGAELAHVRPDRFGL